LRYNEELTSPGNDHFVLHDSQGFGPGEIANFDTVTNFIEKRIKETRIEDQLHAIWFCIQTPYRGSRVFETGDENFLRRNYKVPIIVIFTQYDRLFNDVRFTSIAADFQGKSEDMIKSIVEERTAARFEETCVRPLKSYNPKLQWAHVSVTPDHWDTCTALVEKTGNLLLNTYMKQKTQIQKSLDSNIEVSIKLGMESMASWAFTNDSSQTNDPLVLGYWLDLASSPHLDGRPLLQRTRMIQRDMIQVWNFDDPEKVLSGRKFEAMLIRLIGDLANPGKTNESSEFPQELKTIEDILSGSIPDFSPGNAALYDWIFGVYKKRVLAPTTLRTLMGFIVDLIVVLKRLFCLVAHRNIHTILAEHVKEVFSQYIVSAKRIKVHQEITNYVDNLKPTDPDEAHMEMKRLIGADLATLGAGTGVKKRSITTRVAQFWP